jgi:hypothetical protein
MILYIEEITLTCYDRYIRNNLEKQPLGAVSGEMAQTDDLPTSGGLMNNPKAQEKKWSPTKMIPDTQKSVRPDNSLASQFGPSQTEMAL